MLTGQQMACQVVHYPHHSQLEAEPAPEPRDVVWNKIAITPRERLVRSLVVMGAMTFLLLFWAGAYLVITVVGTHHLHVSSLATGWSEGCHPEEL